MYGMLSQCSATYPCTSDTRVMHNLLTSEEEEEEDGELVAVDCVG